MINHIKSYCVISVVMYLLGSFYSVSFDISNWSDNSRLSVVVCTFSLMFFSSRVVQLREDKLRKRRL